MSCCPYCDDGRVIADPDVAGCDTCWRCGASWWRPAAGERVTVRCVQPRTPDPDTSCAAGRWRSRTVPHAACYGLALVAVTGPDDGGHPAAAEAAAWAVGEPACEASWPGRFDAATAAFVAHLVSVGEDGGLVIDLREPAR